MLASRKCFKSTKRNFWKKMIKYMFKCYEKRLQSDTPKVKLRFRALPSVKLCSFPLFGVVHLLFIDYLCRIEKNLYRKRKLVHTNLNYCLQPPPPPNSNFIVYSAYKVQPASEGCFYGGMLLQMELQNAFRTETTVLYS